MKYILRGSNVCCQIYLSQYIFCTNHARMVGRKSGIFCRNAMYIWHFQASSTAKKTKK